MLATVTTRLRHQVRLVHASSGEPIRGLSARLSPMPYGWIVRTLPGVVVVAARTGVPEPAAAPVLAVTVIDGAQADLLVLPPLPGRPPRTVVVTLGAAQPVEIVVPLHPVAMPLTVVLSTPAGDPGTGRTLTARGRAGPEPRPVVALPETAERGVYRSEPVEWTAALTPADLLVDGTWLRTLSVDLHRARTVIQLVDTT